MCPARWKTRWGRGRRPCSTLSASLVGAWNRRGCPGRGLQPSRPLFPCCDRGFSWGLQAGGFPPPPASRPARTAGGNRRGSQLSTPITTGCLPTGGLAGGPAWSQRGHPTPPHHWQNMFSCFPRGSRRLVPILSQHRN